MSAIAYEVPATIAYEVPFGVISGNQDYTGALGADFVVNSPVCITALGAFDSDQDGMKSDVTVAMWDRGAGDTIIAGITPAQFTAAAPGELIGTSRFKSLGMPYDLAAGTYSIVAYGYGPMEENVNTNAASFESTPTTNDGGGVLSFGPDSRYDSSANGFPSTTFPSPNVFGAGTFTFVDGACPSTPLAFEDGTIAYEVPFGVISGNQDYTGALGMDFEVNSPVCITALGAFDSDQDGMKSDVTVAMWDRGAGDTLIAGITPAQFTAAAPGELIGTSRFKSLGMPYDLAAGTYSVVAYGYGPMEENVNTNNPPFESTPTTNDGGGVLSFGPDSRFDSSATGFPSTTFPSPNVFGAGTFTFVDGACPSASSKSGKKLRGRSEKGGKKRKLN
jgi:hypothetical protein